MNAPATDFSPGPAETDKTGETDAVGNGDFLRAVFGDAVDDTQPVVVSFAGNPFTAVLAGLRNRGLYKSPVLFGARKPNRVTSRPATGDRTRRTLQR